jgi:hypothetical protein
MNLVRLIITLEVSQQGTVSTKSFDIERMPSPLREMTVQKMQPIPNAEDVVPTFLSKLSHNQNEMAILRMLIEAKRGGTQVYRRQILSSLGLDQLLQWNGVSAWLTRNWRAATGNPYANITAIRYDQEQEDYEITFDPDISDEVIERLAEGFGVGR